MEAIIEKGITYKVTGEKGAFTITEDPKGKVKMFQTSIVEVVEVTEMPKAKVYKRAAEPVSEKAKANASRMYAKEKSAMSMAILQDHFCDSQIKSGNYNINLTK